jgi:hypothetical protein
MRHGALSLSLEEGHFKDLGDWAIDLGAEL